MRVIIVILSLVVYVLATDIITDKYFFIKRKGNRSAPKVELEYVVVHLDLKGAPPKLSYLQSLLPMMKKHGVNGLLIEYEDMFPYEGYLTVLKKRNSYKKKELHAYLTAAASSGFEIIPLVQTFGHMEFALKHPEYVFLREDPEFPDCICPSFSESQDLLTEHVKFLIKTVRILSPDTTVLIWDDMYRSYEPTDFSDFILTDAEVVHWAYTAKPYVDVHINMTLNKYGHMFDNIWIATAFKGADGKERILPDLNIRFNNHLHWLNFIFEYGTLKKLYKIKGIILTGWSRYNHAAPLCEILPASIPSLIINLILIQKYTSGIVLENMKDLNVFIDEHIENNLDSSLLCQNRSKRFLDIFDSNTCHYEESDLYTTLQLLSNAYKYFDIKIKNASNDEKSRIEYEYISESI
ncbi:hexosaminidase D-like [Cydia amplana]|uniref:hexosaminidase D-like n=1 Tax=Cydia amplana TaxID=1869771 RepID=UPI002FE672A7